ncbi:hypothetical protein KCV03_g383, partial [Aureobasidium melanogenum]
MVSVVVESARESELALCSQPLYTTNFVVLSAGNSTVVWSPRGRLWCSGWEAHQKNYLATCYAAPSKLRTKPVI